MDNQKINPSHFHGKEPIDHIAQVQAEGMIASIESHGIEAPGHYNAAYDAARETAMVLSIFLLLFHLFSIPDTFNLLMIFACVWTVWKTTRSGSLGWQRLERFHRLIAEEKWEIEHHRDQERDELLALYEAKGFQGQLLNEVVDVLMSDEDRLLRIMIEEELNLKLENQEHPLKEAFGAFIGASLAAFLTLSFFKFFPPWGGLYITMIIMGTTGFFSAHQKKNQCIGSSVWSISMAILCLSAVYFLFQMFHAFIGLE